jgi:acyl-CoA thioester hydrolase
MKIEAPLLLHNETVRPEWLDYNGHMNLAFYVLVFDHATDRFLEFIGMSEEFRDTQQASTFAAEIHVCYEQEVGADDEIYVTTQLLGFDEKRIHYFHYMYNKNEKLLVATNELMSLYMDMSNRRVGVMPDTLQQKLADIQSVHSKLPVPKQAGRVIGVKKRRVNR